MPDCEVCHRPFATSQYLKQHIGDSLKNSPEHEALCCQRCGKKIFVSVQGRQQHLMSSNRHNMCDLCTNSRDFSTRQALEQHRRDKHFSGSTSTTQPATGERSGQQQSTTTTATPSPTVQSPLDRFFSSYPSFRYDPSLLPSESWRDLSRHLGLRHKSEEGRELKSLYQDALRQECDVWFGKEDDIHSWHALCRAVGVQRPPDTIPGCNHVLRNTHVNIVDLIQWGRSGETEPAEVFATERELVDYSLENDRIFPSSQVRAEDGETNVVLRHLMRFILRGRGRKNRS